MKQPDQAAPPLTPPGIQNLQLADDEMSARIDLNPTPEGGKGPSLEEVLDFLRKAGVVEGIQTEAIAAVLSLGRPEVGLVVALGRRPQPGHDATIRFGFRLNNRDPLEFDAARRAGQVNEAEIVREPVLAGDILARKVPAKAGVDGRTVTGRLLEAPAPKDLVLTAGANTVFNEDGQTLVLAEGLIVGYPEFSGGEVSVVLPLRLTEDRMQALLDIHPPSHRGVRLSEELVIRLLKQQKVSYGIRKNTIIRELARVSEEGVPLLGLVAAQGTPPVQGSDASFDLLEPGSKRAGRVSAETGRIDYRERNLIRSVRAEEVVARKTPAQKGIDGRDVLGTVLPAVAGQDKTLPIHSNVAVSDDGLVYTAMVDGMFTLVDREKLAVVPAFEVNGDVGYVTGNLEMAGALVIKGSVRPSFTVRAGGDIQISGGVEDAVVVSCGSIAVTGGIFGMGNARITAEGDISARFFEQAWVQAGGNIEVCDQIMRSTVFAAGRLSAVSGKGRIRGGSVAGLLGVEANEIGSDAGAKTLVVAGVNLPLRRRIAEIKRQIIAQRRERAKMDTVLGRYLGQGKRGADLPKELARRLSGVAKQRRTLVLGEERLARMMAELARGLASVDLAAVRVAVKSAIYLGTTVLIGDAVFRPSENIKRAVSLRRDEASGKILIE